uniref:Uncharacterized protein n=1 Tax=Anopheles culicifacies TaxID=139723 RepID=A0A182ME62_9DIPT
MMLPRSLVILLTGRMMTGPLSIKRKDRAKVRAAEVQDLLERFPEVAIQRGVDDGIEQRVGVPEPQEERRQRRIVIVHEGAHQRQYEERQPADRERRHDDAERGRCLPFLGELKP